MKVYIVNAQSETGLEAFYSLTETPEAIALECVSVIYAVQDYRTDVIKPGSTVFTWFLDTKEKAEKMAAASNAVFVADEYCNWRSRVVLLPVF